MRKSKPAALLLAGLIAGLPLPSAAADNAFNPRISLILQAGYADYSSAAEADIPGYALGPETEFRPAGLALGESELSVEANVDHRFRGWATVAFEQEDGETVVAVEEAYINTLSLPAGLALKFGRFLSDIGYHNRQHSHSWDFADAPLAYRAMLANRLADDGLQLRWVAPTDLYLETGLELFRGAAFPAGGEQRPGIGLWTAFARTGGDWGRSSSWRLGLSHVYADADDRRSGETTPLSYTGDSRVLMLDAVWKWAPNGDASRRNLVLQAEILRRSEHGQLISDPDGNADSSDYDGRQSGYYLQGVWQFMPRWRVGLRQEQLRSANRLSNPAAGTALETLASDHERPQRQSLMLDYSPSEFSRFRLQYNHDRSRPGGDTDAQWLLQTIFSLGAHPAHQF